MPDYSYIHIGRGRIYSDLNKGSDSTIESSYLNPKLNKVEVGAIDPATLAELKQRLSAIEQNSGDNAEIQNLINQIELILSKPNLTQEDVDQIKNLITQIENKGGEVTEEFKDKFNQLADLIEIEGSEIEPIPLDVIWSL